MFLQSLLHVFFTYCWLTSLSKIGSSKREHTRVSLCELANQNWLFSIVIIQLKENLASNE